ncbi:MAG: succinate dehydrogenase iron-sulfur subunit [Candidatus Sumerlaeia bacterium]|nr:succinate dehydrogenase iron-sulfur subunit [Candidatus Sumerlaeia bacterium]
MPETIELRIKRQSEPGAEPYWETFRIPYKANMNVISCLMEIRQKPATAEGKATAPVSYDAACLEEVCGSCSMRINGVPRQACSALVDELEQPIVLEPFSKFPVMRDLLVDRSRMFEALKRVRAWVPLDGTYDLGAGPHQSPQVQEEIYPYSRCMTCGCCLEACPQVNENSSFIGAAAIGQAYRFNTQPGSDSLYEERMQALMGPGGVGDCGNAQNCVRVCPKEIPLTDAIAEMGRELTVYAVKSFFKA